MKITGKTVGLPIQFDIYLIIVVELKDYLITIRLKVTP